MNFDLFYGLTLAVSMATMLAAIWMGIKSYRMEYTGKGDALYKKHFFLRPFQIFLICFFFGIVILFVPIYYTGYFYGESPVIRLLKTVLLSIHNTMRFFILDGDFDIIQNAVVGKDYLHHGIGSAYALYGSIVFVAAPVMTASIVLSFFKNASAHLKYTLSFSKDIYYISDLNEMSIALATDIMAEGGIKKPLVAFFNVTEGGDDVNCELVDQAKRLGAICFGKSITEIGLKYYRLLAKRKFYFISEQEDENVKQALTLIKHCQKNGRYNQPNTQFYVFATTADSEVLLDSVEHGEMKVRRINENRNLVINTLQEKPIFENYIEQNGEKKVAILIIGGGNYGTELIKAISWCGQMPGYCISIHVVDKSMETESYFSGIAPELMKKNKTREQGEPYYEITFHTDVDVYGNKFLELLGEIENITTAFVTLGDDKANLDVAMRIRREYGRLHLQKGYQIPHIYSVVYSTLKTQTLLQNGGLLCLGKDDFNIQFLGDVRTRYSLDVIEQLDLEEKGMRVHLNWLERRKAAIISAGEDQDEINAKIEESRLAYNKYEYYRRASIASAVYQEVLAQNGITFASVEEQKKYEHFRWNAFMRAEGFVYDAETRDHIAKTHPSLKPYEILTRAEQEKDYIILTPTP